MRARTRNVYRITLLAPSVLLILLKIKSTDAGDNYWVNTVKNYRKCGYKNIETRLNIIRFEVVYFDLVAAGISGEMLH